MASTNSIAKRVKVAGSVAMVTFVVTQLIAAINFTEGSVADTFADILEWAPLASVILLFFDV